MAHRLLHSLVISSLFALEGSGCTSSHDRPPLPPPPPDGDDAGTWWLDAGAPRPRDAGVRRSDAGRSPSDAGAPADAGPPDAAAPSDAGAPSDGGFAADGGEMPMCEPGWPTTKGFFCTELENGEIVCCDSLLLPDGGGRCCVPEGE